MPDRGHGTEHSGSRPDSLFDDRDLVAIRIAWDELTSYIETTGDEGSLDDEEMPDGRLRWAADRLEGILRAYGESL